MNKGWTCPQCGKVYAPYVDECAECNGGYTITYPPIYPAPVYPVPYYPQPVTPYWPYSPSYPIITCDTVTSYGS